MDGSPWTALLGRPSMDGSLWMPFCSELPLEATDGRSSTDVSKTVHGDEDKPSKREILLKRDGDLAILGAAILNPSL